MPLNYKVQFADGATIKLMGLPDATTLDELRAKLYEKSGVQPEAQHLLTGFPPKPVEGDGSSKLSDLGITSGAVLIVKERMEISTSTNASKKIFMRRVVPADNSCLFNSIGYALGKGKQGNGAEMRKLIIDTIKRHPDRYTEVFLGRPVEEYCTWIQNDASWGGEIELEILCKFYKVEIVVFDVTSMSRLCYGEDQGFTQRMFLLYDGVHYDIVVETPSKSASESQDTTLFSINDFAKVEKASEVAIEAHQNHEYTDLNRFNIQCMDCRQPFVGEKEAQEHAMQTGHQRFGEVKH